ncbi:NAD(P)-dependent alcohol dehydrogenase [Aspergillus affinis]|uniref:NAD(P)-dependent alcohol dehydrogenase n=1 Tax=Aspergillus affinis TaxID=1070780 RepID=UPI0022FE0687|nr:zinc-binding oxidoreductase [Aspergillus affinis]KAI9042761.1 zinc-binding oxidoreductase [Aspergillus affinis]
MSDDTSETLPRTMKAWTFSHSGPPQSTLQLSQDIPLPTLRTETSLLIRVCHVSVHPGTVIMMNLIPSLFRPSLTIAETDFSGIIVAAGKKVPTAPSSDNTRYFSPGSTVFGSLPVSKHLKGSGVLAEYVVVDMTSVARKPENVSFAEAAGLPVSGSTALTLLDAARLQPDDKLLLNAPCGGIGHFVAQLTKTQGDHHIVGICSRTSAQLARGLGCDEVIDYHATDDGTSLEETLSSNFRGDNAFDAIIDAHGSQPLWHSAPGFLKPSPGHAYTSVGPALRSYTFRAMCRVLKDMVLNQYLPKWMGGVAREFRQVTSIVDVEKLERLRGLAEEGSLKTYLGGEWDFEDAMQVCGSLLLGGSKED